MTYFPAARVGYYRVRRTQLMRVPKLRVDFEQNAYGPGEDVSTGNRAFLVQFSDTYTAPRYPQLIGVRVCLGIAEAGLPPGVFY